MATLAKTTLTPARPPTEVAEPGVTDQVEISAIDPTDGRPWANFQKASTRLEKRPDGSYNVDNVRWGFREEGEAKEWPGIFKDLNIDPRHIKNVYLGVKPFKPEILAAHSVLIFEMDDDHPVTNAEGQTDRGLVLSMEARLHQGERYSMPKTLSGKYGVVYQLGTFTDLMQKTTRRENLSQILYKLELDDKQKEQLLKNTLEASVAGREGQYYNLFTNSCHSVAIDLVSSVVPDKQKMHRWLLPHVYNPAAALPPYGDMLFAGHHLLSHEARRVIQPSEELFGPQRGQTRLGSVLREISSSPLFTPTVGTVGAIAGAAGGAALVNAVNLLPPIVGIPLGVVAGGYVGARTGVAVAETIERRTNSVYEPSSKYFPPHNGC